jgi:phospholipid/cholesterol/gamma-HCH transport system substrate-binding protein
MQRNLIETVLGGVVLIVAAVFVAFAYSNASLQTSSGYQVTARFDKIGTLKEGGDVKLSGIKVGSVTRQWLDNKTYQAVVVMTIEPNVKLPTDTAAEVAMESLMGGNYVLLTPGAADKVIPDGGVITATQGAISLGDLVGRAMFSSKDDLSGDGGLGPAPAPAPAPAPDKTGGGLGPAPAPAKADGGLGPAPAKK